MERICQSHNEIYCIESIILRTSLSVLGSIVIAVHGHAQPPQGGSGTHEPLLSGNSNSDGFVSKLPLLVIWFMLGLAGLDVLSLWRPRIDVEVLPITTNLILLLLVIHALHKSAKHFLASKLLAKKLFIVFSLFSVLDCLILSASEETSLSVLYSQVSKAVLSLLATLSLGSLAISKRRNSLLSHYENSNIVSKITFNWLNSVFQRQREEDIGMEEIDPLPQTESVPENYAFFSEKLTQHSDVARALLGSFGRKYFLMGVIRFVLDLLLFSGPLLLEKIIAYLSGTSETPWTGLLLVTLLLGFNISASCIQNQYDFYMTRISIRVRSVLVMAVFGKTLRVTRDPNKKHNMTSGRIMNVMSIDTDKIVNFINSFHSFWSLPLQIAVSLYLLWSRIRVALFGGLSVIIVLIPINICIMKMIARISAEILSAKDKRIEIVREMVQSMSTVKFLGVEELFQKRIMFHRRVEIQKLKRKKYLDALCVYFWATTPVLMTFSTFLTYSLVYHETLNASRIFVSISLFGILNGPLNAFPWVVNGLIEAVVSLKRLQTFLDVEEVPTARIANGSSMINIKNLHIQYEETAVLDDVSVEFVKGETYIISGETGSGKSTLLLTLLREIESIQGMCDVNTTRLSYVGQTPWIQQGTVMENILFGNAFISDMYHATIESCCLVEDLLGMPNGDQTLIGERGVNLSGGQRARLALARAVYCQSDVLLLDDPFSALDTHVGAHIAKHCILKQLKNRTVILITHHSHYFAESDVRFFELKHGKLHETDPSNIISEAPYARNSEENFLEDNATLKETHLDLIAEEERKSGVIHRKVFLDYLFAVGRLCCVGIFLSLVLMQSTRNLNDYFLSVSSSQKMEVELFIQWLVVISVSNNVFTLARAFSFAYGGLSAAVRLYEKLLSSVLFTHLEFFESTPLGRIINRFSSDMYTIDEDIPFISNIFLASLFKLIGSIVILSLVNPFFLILLIPLILIYFSLQKRYRVVSRDLKRLESITRSPLYSNFSQIIEGIVQVRAFNAQERFIQENIVNLDKNQRVVFISQGCEKWLLVRLQALSVATIAFISVGAIIGHSFFRTNAALVGLALTYALPITDQLSSLLWSFTQTEKEIVAVERVGEYSELPHEQKPKKGRITVLPLKNWPYRGDIRFENVSLQYKSAKDFALSDINFKVIGPARIGIIGRTGSGKSSLLQALFHMREGVTGRIVIDGINIFDIDQQVLRRSLCIIPQTPVLFGGPFRENLDPFNEVSDEDIWEALRVCEVKEVVENCVGNDLSSVMSSGDSRFSHGEKQLICLARALIHKKKIICLDEATSNVV